MRDRSFGDNITHREYVVRDCNTIVCAARDVPDPAEAPQCRLPVDPVRAVDQGHQGRMKKTAFKAAIAFLAHFTDTFAVYDHND